MRYKILLIVAVIALLLLVGYKYFHTQTYTGEVVGFTWRNTVAIVKFAQVRGSDWERSMPGDAYNASCYQRHWTTIKVGKIDIPQYRSYCNYTVDRWIKSREVVTKGDYRNDPLPYFGEVVLANGSPYGAEGVSKYVIWRWIKIDTGNSVVACRVKEDLWLEATYNQKVTVEKRDWFGWKCESLKLES